MYMVFLDAQRPWRLRDDNHPLASGRSFYLNCSSDCNTLPGPAHGSDGAGLGVLATFLVIVTGGKADLGGGGVAIVVGAGEPVRAIEGVYTGIDAEGQIAAEANADVVLAADVVG